MIKIIFNIFNNREIAFAILFLVFIIFLIVYKKTFIKSIKLLLKAAINKHLLKVYFFMFSYIFVVFYLFYLGNIWDRSLLKDSIFWSLGTAFIMLMNANKITKEPNFFKKSALDNIKFMIILEFIIALHPFSLLWELFLQFIIILFFVINIYISINLKENEKHINLYKTTNVLLKFFGSIFIIASIYKTVINIEIFFILNVLRSFLFSPVMTILFLPFLYFVVLYMKYGTYYSSIRSRLNDDKKLFRYAKFRIFIYNGFNLKKLKKFTIEIPSYRFNDIEEIKILFKELKSKKL